MKQQQGFTLVESVITLVVLGLVFYAVLSIFITSNVKSVNVEIFTVAQSLAEAKIEETMALSFLSVTNESSTAFSGELSNYSYEIVSDYVSTEALDLPVVYETDYKRVQVLIRHPQLDNPTTLETLVTNY